MFSITGVMSKVSSFLSTATAISSRLDSFLRQAPPILLEDIELELVSEISQTFENEVPTTPIDDGTQISDNISSQPLTITFKVQIVGNNHRSLFDKILELREKRKLVTLYLIKQYSNLAITNIENTISSLHYTEFTISFVQVQIARIAMIPAPSPKAKPTVSKKTKLRNNSPATTKTVTATKGKKDWEGELQSEKIPLPGGKK